NEDAAVDHRDEAALGDEVHQVTRQRPVDTAEKNVAVECGLVRGDRPPARPAQLGRTTSAQTRCDLLSESATQSSIRKAFVRPGRRAADSSRAAKSSARSHRWETTSRRST